MGVIKHRQYVMNLVRWRKGARRVRQSFPPLAEDHVAGDGGCPLCPTKLGNGLRVVQLAVGPTDRDAARSHAAGEEYTAGAILAHEPCVNRFSDAELEIALCGIDLDFLAGNGNPGTFEGQVPGSAPGFSGDLAGQDAGGGQGQDRTGPHRAATHVAFSHGEP